nr:integrase, catalytic region, zinc finger, CCHC-type, peptidase aspartic, catalytic [Tanacetum cinerariifolium]
MPKNLALIAKYFKKIYKPTNINLRTSSNSRNKNVDTTPRYKNDNQSGQFGNQRMMNVAGARENVGSPVVQQSGIQCFNYKEFGHFAKECKKPKRQYDWLEDTDEEIDEQELKAHYSYMAKIQDVPTADTGTDSEPLEQVQNDTGYNVFANNLQHSEQSESISNTCLVETNDSNVIPDSPDMCNDEIHNDQNDVESDDERVALANLKLDVDENKNIQKQLKKENTTLSQELKEYKTILVKTSKTLGESNSIWDSCLVALQSKQTEFEKYKAFNDRIVNYDKLERKLNETLGQLAQKDIEIKEGLKTKAYEILVVKEKHDELIKQSLLRKSHYEGLFKQKTKVITDLKLTEEHDIDKMLSMEKQLKFLNEIVYKRSQSIQNIHMMAPKVPTYNGRPTFANPRYLKQAQFEIPCLYAFPYDQSTYANRLIPDEEETLALERESQSKLNKDLVQIVDNAWIKHSKDQFHAPTTQDMEILIQTCLMPLALKTQNDSFLFVHELKQEMNVDLKYVESLEKQIDELESDKAEFSNIYDMILQECVSNEVMCTYLLSLFDLDALAELQCKGKSMETKFDKPSVVRQPNAQRIPKPSILGKPDPFLDSLKIRYFSKTKLVPKTNVLEGLSKPVTVQTLPQTTRQAVSNTNVLKPGMYRIDNRTTQTRATQLPQTVRNTNSRMSTSTGVNHKTNISRPHHRSNQLKDKVVPNNSQVKLKKTQVEEHPRISSISNKIKSVTACNDSLNYRTSNVNDVCATCKKCLVDSDHFAYVTKMLNDVNARTKKPNVVPISTRKPKGHANKSVATPLKKKVASKSINQKPQSYFRMLYEKTRLNHNLFSVGQFCYANLEVTFRKSTCFVRDLQGNDLLTGRFNLRRTSLTGFPTQSIRSSNVIALDSPNFLVLISETSQSRQHAKFVGDFQSLAKEVDESLAKHKALELEIERLLRVVVSQDIMSVVQKASVVDTLNLQTELKHMKECFENYIIKKENEYAKLWNDWYKKCEECKFDKISYDKAYKDIKHKIKWLEAQLGDLKGMFRKTSREEKHVPNIVRASARTKLITVSQPPVFTKKDVNSDSNGLSSTGIDNTKTRRPQPRSNTKNDRVPSASKSSRSKNKGNVISKVVCAMCKQCLISVNHDVCLRNYVNGKTSRGYPNLFMVHRIRVYFIEGLGHNLFSVGQFCDSDLEVAFRRNACFVRNLKGVDLLKGDRSTNLYTINLHEMTSASPICLMARASSTKSWLWHQRLSPLNFDTINDLAKNNLDSGLLKFKYHKEHLCPLFEQGKSKRASHPPKPVPNSRQRLHHLHMDLCGPMRIASINEKRNRTLVEAARTMLIFSRAPLFLWAEAIATACFTQNRSIIHRQFNKTPYELINGRKPDISFLHVFGALCYPKNDRKDLGKLGAKGDIGFFIGYSADSCAYRVFNRRTKKIMETINVSFDELLAMAFEQRSSNPGFKA